MGGNHMKLSWGIIGLGQLANEWIAPAIRASNNGQLVACADSIVERADQFGSFHGIDHVYYSYEKLIEDTQVEAVYVATPNALHHPIVLAAARARKHVLCQKPMAFTAREAEEMLNVCDGAGITLRIGLHLRFQRILQASSDYIRQGSIGTVREVSVQRYAPLHEARASGWRHELALAGAGALADVGVHVIDFVQWIIGDQIRRVFAFAYPGRVSRRPDETTTLLLEFENGCQASIRCSRKMPIAANDLQIFGTGGMLATGPLRGVDTHRLRIRTPGESHEMEYPAENLYFREVEAFADAVTGKMTPAATGGDGLRLVRVTEALIRSLETGSAISL